MDNFRNTSKDFYDDLGKGKVEAKDFERYIYGKSSNHQRGLDDRDLLESKGKKDMLEIQREVMAYKPK